MQRLRALRDLFGLVLLILSATACGRSEGGLSREDKGIVAEKLRLMGVAWPLGDMMPMLRWHFRDPTMGHGGTETSFVPLMRAEEEAVLAEFDRFQARLTEEPVWNGDAPLSGERREKEGARLRAQWNSLDAIRRLLAPYRTWLEDHFGGKEKMQEFFAASADTGVMAPQK